MDNRPAAGGGDLGRFLGAHLTVASSEERVAWARRRFFEEDVRPTGLVGEEVLQSWSRCLAQRQRPEESLDFNPVTRSRLHSVQARHRDLLALAADELSLLQQTLAGTHTVGMLLDAEGVVMHVTARRVASHERLLPLAARVGVCLSEPAVGTNAPALAARHGRVCTVQGGEHFALVNQSIHCAAAPVHGVDGHILAVLDLSSEGQGFGFDAGSVVGLCATAIENRVLTADADTAVILALHVQAGLLETPTAGLLGWGGDGTLRWANPPAARMLGLEGAWGQVAGLSSEATLGCRHDALVMLARAASVASLDLPSGLRVWARCRMRSAATVPRLPGVPLASAPAVAPGNVGGHGVVPAPPDDRLACAGAGTTPLSDWRGHERALLDQTLAECQGNVSAAARRLKVSRGLIYRRLRERGLAAPD